MKTALLCLLASAALSFAAPSEEVNASSALSAVSDAVKTGITSAASGASNMKDLQSSIVDTFSNIPTAILKSAIDSSGNITNLSTKLVTDLFDTVLQGGSGGSNILSKLSGLLGSAPSSLISAATSLGSSALNSLSSNAGSNASKYTNLFNTLVNSFTSAIIEVVSS